MELARRLVKSSVSTHSVSSMAAVPQIAPGSWCREEAEDAANRAFSDLLEIVCSDNHLIKEKRP